MSRQTTYKVRVSQQKLPADMHTPVELYLRLRDVFHQSILLESSDYHGNENSFSFICCCPLATFTVRSGIITNEYPDRTESVPVKNREDVVSSLREFRDSFKTEGEPALVSGLFGYTSYNAIRYFEDISIKESGRSELPDLSYSLYRFIIGINHFNDEMYIIEHDMEGSDSAFNADMLSGILRKRATSAYRFKPGAAEHSSLTDQDFVQMIRNGKDHCRKGNIFQVVLSREFSRTFTGDDFNVYRSLRMVNPSPYLFYFDYGNYRIFGSSPEAQIQVKSGVAQIHPIAGTFRRTGDSVQDAALALKLKQDPKEHSEHVMLVDLARNDLSRSCTGVNVEVFAETQYYSHVIHLVSKVSGQLKPGSDSLQLFADTFPAGTLSGAPKHKAMQLIDLCENSARDYYGGAIGYFGFNGDINHAIIIRSFMSTGNTLYCRAGAGVVIASSEENELQEVNNKLAALKTAIDKASSI